MKKIIIALTALLALASCSKEEIKLPDSWNGELRISSGIATRASGTIWDDGDEIGVFMSETGTYNAVGTHNTKYATTSTIETATFTIDSEFAELYYPQSCNADIVAQYPYNENATVSTYPVDVADQSEPQTIDFMLAKMENVAKSKNPLNLKFYHMLSKLTIQLKADETDGLTDKHLKEATVTVDGTSFAATANVGYDKTKNIPTAEFEVDDEKKALSLTAENNVASFILVPQTADVVISVSVPNIGTFSVPAIAMTLTSSNEYNYTITVNSHSARITGSTINGWGEEASGDLPTTQIKEYKASEIDEDNIPKEDTWVITDAGTITQGQMSGVCAALEAAHNDGRSIAIELPNATLIDAGVFRCNGLATIELPNVTQIGADAFEESSIKEVTFGSIEQISQKAFYKARLTDDENGVFTIPSTVKVMGYGVFMCPFDDETVYNSFKRVIINAPLTTIKQATFQACWNLEEVHLPETVESIEAWAFYGCGQLSESKTLTVYITSPEVVQIDADVNMNIFKGLASTSNAAHKNDVSVTVKVDKDLVDAYNADANWAALMADKTNTYSLQIIANE